jgi:hypothetical protein
LGFSSFLLAIGSSFLPVSTVLWGRAFGLVVVCKEMNQWLRRSQQSCTSINNW